MQREDSRQRVVTEDARSNEGALGRVHVAAAPEARRGCASQAALTLHDRRSRADAEQAPSRPEDVERKLTEGVERRRDELTDLGGPERTE